MKKLKLITALLTIAIARILTAQSPTVTPNIGLQVPAYNQANWQVPIDYDLILLDKILGGLTPTPVIPAYQGTWLSTTTYPLGVFVSVGNTLYASLISGNLDNNPTTSPLDWISFGGGTGNCNPAGTVGQFVLNNNSGGCTSDAGTSDTHGNWNSNSWSGTGSGRMYIAMACPGTEATIPSSPGPTLPTDYNGWISDLNCTVQNFFAMPHTVATEHGETMMFDPPVTTTPPGKAISPDTLRPVRTYGFEECDDSTGSATTQACSTAWAIPFADQFCINYSTTTTNTGALTIDVDTSSNVAVKKLSGGSYVALTGGEVLLGHRVPMCLNVAGNEWDIIGGSSSGGSGPTLAAGSGISLSPGSPCSTGTCTISATGGGSAPSSYNEVGSLVTWGGCSYNASTGLCTVTGSPQAITISSIPGTLGTNLHIHMTGGYTSGDPDTMLQYNGDTNGSHYNCTRNNGTCQGSTGFSFSGAGGFVLNNSTFGGGNLAILNYASSTLPVISNGLSNIGAVGGGGSNWYIGGTWFNSAAVTSISIQSMNTAGGGLVFAVGTVVSLYAEGPASFTPPSTAGSGPNISGALTCTPSGGTSPTCTQVNGAFTVTGNPTSLTLSGVPSVHSVQVNFGGNQAGSSGGAELELQLNGDTTSGHYSGIGTGGAGGVSCTYMCAGFINGTNAGGYFTLVGLDDPNNQKTVNGQNWVPTVAPQQMGGSWNQTATVTSFTMLIQNGAGFSSNFRFSVYSMDATPTGAGSQINIGNLVTWSGCTFSSSGNCAISGSSTTTVGISNIPAGYNSIIVKAWGMTNASGKFNDQVHCTVNGDSTSSDYQWGDVEGGFGASPAVGGANNSGFLVLGLLNGASSGNTPGQLTSEIQGYASTAFNKVAEFETNLVISPGNQYKVSGNAAWTPGTIAAINALSCTLQFGPDYVAGSYFTIYGVK